MHQESDSNEAGVDRVMADASVGVGSRAEPDEALTWTQGLVSPFVCMLRPTECGRHLASAPLAAIVALLMGLTLIGVAVLAGVIVDGMWEGVESEPGESTFRYVGLSGAWRLLESNLGPPFVTALMIVGLTALCMLIVIVVLAWLTLPITHRSGSVLRSYGRSLCAATGIVGPSVLIAAALCISIAMCQNAFERYMYSASSGGPSTLFLRWEFINLVMSLLAFALLALWMTRAAIGARSPTAVPVASLTCELCGYDLTHQPAGGRCTECGADTAISLEPGLRRIGVAWERESSAASWFQANRDIVLEQRTFYERLIMRRQETSGFQFAFRNYVAIGVASMMSMLGVILATEPAEELEDYVQVGVSWLIVSAIGAWLLHGLVGATALTMIAFRSTERPFAHISKVWQYESAFLWVAFFIGHSLAWSFALMDNWMTKIANSVMGTSVFMIEPLVVLVIFVGFIALWLARYMRAVRIVQWANL
ncbi:MAG TPA: hypothetical protein PK093_14495 [Phycisphaerae bacterium]|nr:hypothetical protein [Phycisphaerae bacterium]